MFENKKKTACAVALSLLAALGACVGGQPTVKGSAANLSESSIHSIISSAEEKIEKLYDLNVSAVQDKIAETRGYVSSSNMAAATDAAYELLSMTGESQPVTARSVWHRPTEKSLAELEASLDIYEDIGVNLVYVETFYHGYSMFKSNYVPYYVGFDSANYGEYDDYLDAFSTLAAERGIETHAWVENFYVGVNANTPLLQRHSDWVMYNDEVQTVGEESSLTYLQREEKGYIFIDPANDSVCDFLIEYYKELLEKNPLVKGLNLDYIRYPVSTQSTDTGYTRKAMYLFATEVGLEEYINPFAPIVEVHKAFKENVLSVSGNYQKWCQFRRQKITDFVERIYKEIKSEYPVTLSTAVFSSVNDSYEKKKQDWQTWFRNGWIDVATPMAYLDTAAQVKSAVQTMKNLAGETCYYYTGLASSYRGFPAYENVNQIQASYDGGANGYAIFCATQVLGMADVQKVLKLGFNSKKAVLPHAETGEVVKAYFDALKDRAERLYVPSGKMTAAQKTALSQKLDEILAMDMQTAEEIALVRTKVGALNCEEYASGYAKDRIEEQTKGLYDLLLIKINRANAYEALPKPQPPEDESSSSESSSTESSSSSGSSGNSTGAFGCFASAGAGYVPTAICFAWALKKRRKR